MFRQKTGFFLFHMVCPGVCVSSLLLGSAVRMLCVYFLWQIMLRTPLRGLTVIIQHVMQI